MTPVERVLERLPSHKTTRDGWIARCPAHDDHTPSLGVSEGRDGRALLCCHAGCKTDAVLSALGLAMSDLMPPREQSAAPVPRRVITYDYKDEQGRPLFRVERSEPKQFRQSRWEGGRYVPGLGSTRRVIYRLDALSKQRPKALVICEGEKDVDALVRQGMAATTNPMGAGKWTENFTSQLVSCGVKTVAVIPDNDQPGDDHAERVAASCQQAGLFVKVVRLPNLPPKGDVSNWLAQPQNTAKALASLIDATPVWTPPAQPVTGHAETPRDHVEGPRPSILRLSDVEPEAIDWIWPGRLARGKKTMLAADPGVGKSTVSIDIAARITRGDAWPDGGRAPLGDVLFLCAEDGLADTVRPRVDAAGGDARRIHILDGIEDEKGKRPVTLSDVVIIEQAIEEIRPVLFVIDPITAYLGRVDSYKDAEVRGLLTPLLALLQKHGTALLTIAHLSKDQQKAALHRPANSIAFVAAARLAFAIGRHDEALVMVPIKGNIAKPAASLMFRIEAHQSAGITTSRVEWSANPVAIDAETLLGRQAGGESRAERADAEDFLREMLSNGPVSAKDVFSEARAAGISERQVKAAKAAIGANAVKAGFGSTGKWIWSLPASVEDEDAKENAISSTPNSDPLSPLSPLRPENSTFHPKKINSVALTPLAAGDDGERF